jgi:hypothetical protein
MERGLLTLHPFYQFLDPSKHSRIADSGRHALVMLDLAVKFDALLTHGTRRCQATPISHCKRVAGHFVQFCGFPLAIAGITPPPSPPVTTPRPGQLPAWAAMNSGRSPATIIFLIRQTDPFRDLLFALQCCQVGAIYRQPPRLNGTNHAKK